MKDVGLQKGYYRFCEDCEKHKNYKRALLYFETEEELQALTGLNHDELWDADFDLDDWDYGFAIDIKAEITWRLEFIFDRLDNNYCKRVVEHNGMRYIMYYHA